MWSSCGRCWWSVSSCHRLQPCVIELLRGYLCPPPKWPLPPPECPPLQLELLPLDTLRDDDPPPEKLRDEPPPEILLDELRLELPEKLRDGRLEDDDEELPNVRLKLFDGRRVVVCELLLLPEKLRDGVYVLFSLREPSVTVWRVLLGRDISVCPPKVRLPLMLLLELVPRGMSNVLRVELRLPRPLTLSRRTLPSLLRAYPPLLRLIVPWLPPTEPRLPLSR